jgi:hypothetical protein
MKQIYTASYVLILIWFIREMIREISPDPDTKKMYLYLNLPHYQRSVRLATSVSLSRLEQAKAELIADNWNEAYLKITDGEPKYKPINIESPGILAIYDQGTVNEILDRVRKFIKTPNM